MTDNASVPFDTKRRLVITMSPEMWADIEERAKERDITITELVRRAVVLDKYLYEHDGVVSRDCWYDGFEANQ